MQFKMVVLNTGYMETGSLGTVTFQYQRSTPAAIEGPAENALSHLATSLFEAWWWDIWHISWDYSKNERRWDLFGFLNLQGFLKSLPTLTANSFTGEDLSGWWPWLLWDEIARVPLTETIHVFENAEVLLPLCIDWSVFEADPLHSEEVFSKTKEIYSSTFDSIDRSMTVDEHKRKLLKRSCKTWEE